MRQEGRDGKAEGGRRKRTQRHAARRTSHRQDRTDPAFLRRSPPRGAPGRRPGAGASGVAAAEPPRGGSGIRPRDGKEDATGPGGKTDGGCVGAAGCAGGGVRGGNHVEAGGFESLEVRLRKFDRERRERRGVRGAADRHRRGFSADDRLGRGNRRRFAGDEHGGVVAGRFLRGFGIVSGFLVTSGLSPGSSSSQSVQGLPSSQGPSHQQSSESQPFFGQATPPMSPPVSKSSGISPRTSVSAGASAETSCADAATVAEAARARSARRSFSAAEGE